MSAIGDLMASFTASQYSSEEMATIIRERINGGKHVVFATDDENTMADISVGFLGIGLQGKTEGFSFASFNKATRKSGVIHIFIVAKTDVDKKIRQDFKKRFGQDMRTRDIICVALDPEHVMAMLEAFAKGTARPTEIANQN